MGQDDLGSEKSQIILKTNSQSISILIALSHNMHHFVIPKHTKSLIT